MNFIDTSAIMVLEMSLRNTTMIPFARPLLLLTLSLTLCSACQGQSNATDEDLIGLWEGQRIAGPEVQGKMLIRQHGEDWWADVAGYTLNVAASKIDGGTALAFGVPGDRGSFAGRLDAETGQIIGHWTQPGTLNNGMPHASPVILSRDTPGQWRGEIVPLLDEFTVFLPVTRRDDGSLGAFLRNPDRGFGVFLNVDRIEREDDRIRWIGQFLRNPEERVLAEAVYQSGHMAVNIRGNLYDMRRLEDDRDSHFYARGKTPAPYRYIRPPLIREDGWPVGSLQQAGIDEGAIGRFIDEVILPTADSIDDPYLHGMLIARSGTLVLEEYFHGFHRNKAHDTRSASKSLAAVLAGAVLQADDSLSLDSPVFKTILGEAAHEAITADPRKGQITLEHLISMSSGQDCDDGDSNSRGNEDNLQSQSEQPDWYRYTLDLDMVRAPGEQAVYCTAGMNLVGAVLSAATDRTIEDLFYNLIARPLQIDHYYLNLSPTGQPYLGGGIYWQPRDFMKLGQLMLNEGTWNGQRILGEAFARRSISRVHEIQDMGYGYGWWLVKYPYQDGQISAFFAAGNGGQIVMGIPELDLLVAFYAGNYSHRTMMRIQREFVPEFILPALK